MWHTQSLQHAWLGRQANRWAEKVAMADAGPTALLLVEKEAAMSLLSVACKQ